jgi:archaellum component FlaG (FlaF/FlaG flagellin family)
MDKVLTATLLTMAAVVAAIMVINTMLPALGKASSSLISSTGAASDQIKTNLDIVHVATNTSTNQILVYVKNIGTIEITDIDSSDVFLQTGTATYDRITYNAGSNPKWIYTIQDSATAWTQNRTVLITITVSSLTSGDYKVRIVTPNGVSTEESFSV